MGGLGGPWDVCRSKCAVGQVVQCLIGSKCIVMLENQIPNIKCNC